MIGRALTAAGLLAAAALHASVTGQLAVPGLALLLALAAVPAGPRLDPGQAAQALTLVGSALLAFAVALVEPPLPPADGGPKLQYAVASCAALLTVAARLWFRAPERGAPATWAIGLVVFYGCGRVASPLYLPLAATYLGLAWAHRAAGSGAGRHRSTRHVLAGAAMLAAAGLLAAGTTTTLRAAYEDANAFVLARVVGGEVGFGAGAFGLGSMDGMRTSDAVILRAHGPVGPHFRGQAYTEYRGGTWLPPGGPAAPVPAAAAPEGAVTLLEFVSDDEQRLFLPPEARAVAVDPAPLLVDTLGVPRPAKDPPVSVRFDSTGPRRLAPVPPGPADLEVDPTVAAAIGPLVGAWVTGAPTPRARVDAIRSHLERDYTYSLHYERDPGRDPVVQFLLESKLGHCEYFASAMALAVRQAGVPARVVTGFRSTETSPFGGHRIVRSRDAHAWVEVHLDGRWETVDPSPQNSREAGPTRAWLAGALDDLARAWGRGGPQVLVAVLLVWFVGLQIRTLIRGRRAAQPDAPGAWVEGPPGWLVPLLHGLSGLGLERSAAEPVEAFAGRAAAAGQAEAGALLRRYAAHRYGGGTADASLAGAAAAWRPAPPPPAGRPRDPSGGTRATVGPQSRPGPTTGAAEAMDHG